MNMDLRARGRQNEGLEIQENKLLKSAGGNRSYSQGQAGKKKKNRQGAVKNTRIRKSKQKPQAWGAQTGKGAWLT